LRFTIELFHAIRELNGRRENKSSPPDAERIEETIFIFLHTEEILNRGHGNIILLLVLQLPLFLQRMFGLFLFFPAGLIFTSLVTHLDPPWHVWKSIRMAGAAARAW